MNNNINLVDGQLVLRVGQENIIPHPVYLHEDGEVAVGEYFRICTSVNNVSPVELCDMSDITTIKATDPGVSIVKCSDSPIAWQRKYWKVQVDGLYVGMSKTKRDGLRAACIARSIWRANGTLSA